MNIAMELDTILSDLESNSFFSSGLHSAYAWAAAFAYAGAKVDTYRTEDPSEAQQKLFSDRIERATAMLDWAYMRTPEDLRPTAQGVVDQLVKVPDINPTPVQVEEYQSVIGMVLDFDVTKFSPAMVKRSMQAGRVEAAKRVAKFEAELVEDLTRTFEIAAQNPGTLNETFIPSNGQLRQMLSKLVAKGELYFTGTDERQGQVDKWMKAFGQLKQRIHADLIIVGAAVKRANAALHVLEQEIENGSSDPIEIAEGVAIH